MERVAQPDDVGLSGERLARVRAWMYEQVERRRLPGLSVLVARRDQPVFFECAGYRHVEAGLPVTEDTVFRIFSMTKPVVSVAALMLYEQGAFQLDDPVSRVLPEFEHMQVLVGSDPHGGRLEPAARPITIGHLLTHTAGLTYWFLSRDPVSALYREAGIDFVRGNGELADMVARVARLPLVAHPGTQWHYSVATDVLGRVLEVVSGQRLDRFLADTVLAPLGMHDTGFEVGDDQLARFAALYGPPGGDALLAGNAGAGAPDGGLELLESPEQSAFRTPVGLHSAGGGLVSTAADYWRFCRLLLNGGVVDGQRLLGRKTVAYMMRNHLRGDLAAVGSPHFSEARYDGVGFGLGLAVMLDPVRAQILGSPGECGWGGVASTAFWVDPAEDLTVVLLTQLMPSWSYPLRQQLRVLVYQALVD